MPNKKVNTSTSATLVHAPGSSSEHTLIQNLGANTVYVGGSSVSAAAGFPLTPGSEITWHAGSSALYALTSSGTALLNVTTNVS